MRVSPTELEVFNDCELKHHYRYRMRLKPQDKNPPPNMVSGRVVHRHIQNVMKLPVDQRKAALANATLLEQYLHEEFNGDEDNVKKYLAGVKRATSKVPDWMLLEVTDWHIEEPITAQVGDIELYGIPDLWYIDDGEGLVPYVCVIDTKTTDNEPLDFILWNPQLRIYSLMLSQKFPHHNIMYRYLCLPTSEKPAKMSSAHIFTPNAHLQTTEYITRIGGGIGLYREFGDRMELGPQAREGMHCRY